MNAERIHRLYWHFQELPVSMRTLFTSALLVMGLGYLFALIYVLASHGGLDGRRGLSVEDIILTYGGSTEGTRLETALQGPMSTMLAKRDLGEMLQWIRAGASKADYETRIHAIIEQNCLSCHDGSNPHLSNLDGFDNVMETVQADTGKDIYSLVRASHIHMFGITFIFFLLGFIFSHAYIRPLWFKNVVIVMPFHCIAADVASWYFIKLFAPFAWVTMIAGILMAMSFAIMWFSSMYQMWFYTVPEHVRNRARETDGDIS